MEPVTPEDTSAGSLLSLQLREANRNHERKRRVLAENALWRNSFFDFCRSLGGDTGLPWKDSWALEELCEHLQDIASVTPKQDSNEFPRLLVSMPPGHGKSTIAVHRYVAWYMGNNPEHRVIISSYTVDLAREQSEKAKRVMEMPQFKRAFPNVEIDSDKKSVVNWGIKQKTIKGEDGKARVFGGGSVYAVGAGGSITGRRANLLLIDDPVKGADQAENRSERDKVWTWYSTSALTRGLPGFGVVVIGTRWHEDDLIGRIIEHEEREVELWKDDVYEDEPIRWNNVCYRAIATEDEPNRKKGEALHPERYSLRHLLGVRAQMTRREWESLYQQAPYDEEGGLFKVAEMRRYHPPANHLAMSTWCAWDLAISRKDDGDYTVGVALGQDEAGCVYLLEVVRGRWSTHTIVDNIIGLHCKWDAMKTGIEAGALEMAIRPVLLSELNSRGLTSIATVPIPTGNKDKEMRARPFSHMVEKGTFFMPENEEEPWVSDYIAELVRFPNAKHDDQVDATAHGVNMLRTIPTPRSLDGKMFTSQRDVRAYLDRMYDDRPRRRRRSTANTNDFNHRTGMLA